MLKFLVLPHGPLLILRRFQSKNKQIIDIYVIYLLNVNRKKKTNKQQKLTLKIYDIIYN